MAIATDSGYKLRSILVAIELRTFLKTCAEKSNTRLRDLQSDAVTWFLDNTKGKRVHYLASTNRATAWAMWLPVSLIKKVGVRAKRDDITDSRVIYTALVMYAEQVLQKGPAVSDAKTPALEHRL